VAVIAGGVLIWEGVSAGLGSVIGLAGRHRPQLSLSNSPAKVTPPTPNYGDWSPIAGQTPEITAAKDFYYVSKNLVSDPSINATQWSLKIAGMVNAPYNLSYDELRALPSVRQYHTLECISNDVGGNLMSNALFTGVRLADVLNKAGIQSGASLVTFRADDDYSDSLHLSQALNPDSLIVYLINGDPLPQAHGYPARLLIPGLYGMKNGKWLTSLTVGSGTYDGYWEQRGWTHEAMVKMTARIDVPSDGDLLTAKPTAIAGVAYSGDKGIAEVDVSVDGGQSWRVATLRRPLGALTWVLWELPWTPSSGNHIIVARAIDNAGNVQTTAGAPPIPDGASGYDAISVVAH
jgi:DMSO/TMAO reductase YedYZ molybdopterin-dependent catalytic subunit